MPDVVLVHRISGLPRASFRFHLAMDTLASGYALGATPCARDFHPLERAHAGRTKKGLAQIEPAPSSFTLLLTGSRGEPDGLRPVFHTKRSPPLSERT